MDEKEPTKIEELILNGALEIRAVDEDGNFLYGFTEKAKDIAAAEYEKFVESFYSQILKLWELGFLSMDITKENPLVVPTKRAFEKNEIDELDESLKRSLYFIIQTMKNR